jgi:hypothetical protein
MQSQSVLDLKYLDRTNHRASIVRRLESSRADLTAHQNGHQGMARWTNKAIQRTKGERLVARICKKL